jgi:hypothetical protein
VLDWLRKKNALPSYSLLEQVPSRCLPQELTCREESEDYDAWRDRVQADLMESPTDPNSPGFATFLKCGDGLLEFANPEENGKYLLAFSSPYKAADYARVQVADRKFEFFSSSPVQAAQLIPHFHQHAGITHIALDRCPRCPVFAVLDASAMDQPEPIIRAWKIFKATEICRVDLYWNYARGEANRGELIEARDVALELVGHVSAEDPRPHLLLGKLAIRLGDRQLLREAHQALTYFGFHDVDRDLQSASITTLSN